MSDPQCRAKRIAGMFVPFLSLTIRDFPLYVRKQFFLFSFPMVFERAKIAQLGI